MGEARCHATKADGSACGAVANIGASGFCVWHDPDRQAEAATLRHRGATSDKRSPIITVEASALPTAGPPESIADVVSWAAWATRAVAMGVIDARTAREISSLLTTLRHSLERRDLAKQVETLRRQVQELKRLKAS